MTSRRMSYIGPSWAGSEEMATTKSEIAYGAIRQRILEGELAPGTPIDQEAIAAGLRLSTTPVREALRRLEAEHLVVVRAHRDTIVAPVSAELLNHVYTIRIELDPLAAALAAHAATDEQRSVMSSYRDGAPPDASLHEVFYYNRHTHRAIYKACGNEPLVNMLEQLWDMSDRHRLVVLRSEEAIRLMHDDHVLILDAVIAGDGELSRRLMRDHIIHSRASFSQDSSEAAVTLDA